MAKIRALRRDAPLTPSQLVLYENVKATEKIPTALAKKLDQRQLYLSLNNQKTDPFAHPTHRTDLPESWGLQLPANSVVGLPGRTGELLKGASIPQKLRGKVHTPAFRPPWVDHIHHPKLSGLPDRQRTILRTIKGRRINPSYGVFGNDDRVIFYPQGYPWQCIGRVFTWTDASQPN